MVLNARHCRHCFLSEQAHGLERTFSGSSSLPFEHHAGPRQRAPPHRLLPSRFVCMYVDRGPIHAGDADFDVGLQATQAMSRCFQTEAFKVPYTSPDAFAAGLISTDAVDAANRARLARDVHAALHAHRSSSSQLRTPAHPAPDRPHACTQSSRSFSSRKRRAGKARTSCLTQHIRKAVY